MRITTAISALTLADLRAIARGALECNLSDSDFLQTLSAHKCFILYPWVVRAQPTGGLARVTRLSYDKRGNLDKVRILLNIARAFRKAEQNTLRIGGRFST